jgi:hypothetical protein
VWGEATKGGRRLAPSHGRPGGNVRAFVLCACPTSARFEVDIMDLEFEQRRPGIRLGFVFGEQELSYSIRELGKEHRFSADYEHIFVHNPSYFDVANSIFARRFAWTYLAFVGAIAFGFYWRVSPLALAVVTVLGIFLWAFIRMRAPFTLYFVLLPVALDAFSGQGREIQILDDETGARIIEEITARRRSRLRILYAFVNPDADPVHEAAKFDWLKQNQVIDENEYHAALAELHDSLPSDRSVH